MLLRRDDRGVLAIGQASHAWVSGQLARAWGNERFPAPEPSEEVCLAADQHDTGLAGWDVDPELDRATGLPYSFLEMSIGSHLWAWSAAPSRVLVQSRYAALLVSMHGQRLYERRDIAKLSAADGATVREYLHAQHDFQQPLLESLRADPVTAPWATPELVGRNSQLIWIWDYLSLALCLPWIPAVARRAPAHEGPVDLALRQDQGDHGVVIEPWPFAVSELTVRCEGRRLSERSRSGRQLREHLRLAPWETLELRVRAPD